MNKKLMAIAVAGTLGAPALAFAQAANVTLYGHIDGTVRQTKYSSSSVLTGTVPTAASLSKQQMHFNAPRWGLRGSESLGGGLTAYFQIESGMNLDGRAVASDGLVGNLGGRDTYIGLRGSWGSIAMGGFGTAYLGVSQTWNAVASLGHAQQIMGNKDTTGTAPNPNCNSPVPGATGAAAAANAVGLGAFCTSTVEGSSTSFNRRAANYIEYTTPAMSGFTFKFGTALNENKEPSSQTNIVAAAVPGASAYNPKHYSSSLTWAGGPFQAAMGYETHHGFRATNTAAGGIRNAKDTGITLGGKWNYGMGEIGIGWERLNYANTAVNATAGLAAGLATGSNGFRLTNWVINGNYKITPAGTISMGYSKTPGAKNCGTALADNNPLTGAAVGTCGNPTGANMFGLSYDHSLSKRTALYAAYSKINNNGNTAAGATYYYIAGPLSNGAAGTTGGLTGGTDVTSYQVGIKHNF